MKKLYPHQLEVLTESITRDKFGLWMEMRTGKTPLSIRIMARDARKILVIVPKPLVEQWEEEIDSWDNEGREWRVIGKERFRIDYDKLPAYDGIIIDECHRQAGNHKSKFSKSYQAYLKKHNPKKIILLSGTPYSNNSWSVYSLGLALGKKWSWWDWNNRYFYKVRMGRREIPVQKNNIEGEMATILKRLGYTVRLKDITEVPDDEIISEYFDLNAKQKKAIKDTYDPLPIVRFTKQHQIESGVIVEDDVEIPCDKTKRVKELMEEHKKIAIVARYNKQLEVYAKLTDKKVLIINGKTKDRAEVVKEVERLDECVVLINSSCSDGYSLKSVDVMVFSSMSFSYVDYAQIFSRLKDMSKKTGNTYIYLLTRGDSIDQAVYDSVKKKEDFNIKVFTI